MGMTLDKLLALADKATPGPWVVGWWSGQAPDGPGHDCAAMGKLVGTMKGGMDGRRTYHVHRSDLIKDRHRVSRGGEPFTEVLGNYDYEQGGAVREADAAYIAALPPEVVKALIAVAKAAKDPAESDEPCGQYELSVALDALEELLEKMP